MPKGNKFGFLLSVACAIHCAALPILVAFGAGTSSLLSNPWLEGVMVGGALLLGGVFLTKSYRNHHGNPLPLGILLLGFIVFYSSHELMSDSFHSIGAVLGGLMIAFAQLVDHKLKPECGCSSKLNSPG